jgi:hypothetical protein
MHQIDGICFLIFAERGLWNRFVPSLDGYIQDRLNNPIHVPQHGTIKALRLEPPQTVLVRRVVEARLRPALEELPDFADLPAFFPFTAEQIQRIGRTEPTLRDMLQQFRHLFDFLVYGESGATATDPLPEKSRLPVEEARDPGENLRSPADEQPVVVKSVAIVQSPGVGAKHESVEQEKEQQAPSPPAPVTAHSTQHVVLSTSLVELWEQEMRAARRQLEPEGALTGATRELQAGLGAFLQVCHEHGVKVGPWRLHHVVGELTFGDHPTYGVVTIAHWVCKDGQPWKVGIGLFLGRGPGKPKVLEIKLASMEAEPSVIDHLILLRPEDDLTLSGKSKTLWQEAERRGRHARLEASSLDGFAVLYGFPRWLAAVTESLPEGQPVPNLADLLQEKCEKLLEQLCMPVQGG